jgi:uncharacterized protein (DUF1697 family)
MATQIILLRGINLGAANRIAMPALRDALTCAGFKDVRTYVQSGNIVLGSDAQSDRVGEQIRRLIADTFQLEIPVVVRTRDELARVVERNPLAEVATEPKRYQVSFLTAEPSDEVVERLQSLAAEPERLAVIGREIYAWHPDGVARSKLWNNLASKGGLGSGITATTRNWTTVTTLLEMSDAD